MKQITLEALGAETGKFLSHANGVVSLQNGNQGGGEVFILENLPNGNVALACAGAESGKYLSHAFGKLWLQDGNQGGGEEWICHDQGGGNVSYECSGAETGKYLSHAFDSMSLQDGYQGAGELWVQADANILNTAAYCSGDFGPGITEKLIADVQQSGLSTIILWSMHIGRPSIPGQQYGDLVFNDGDIRIVSAGTYNPSKKPEIAQWPSDLAQLKQNGSNVTKIFISIGGWGVEDFQSIQYMLNNGMADTIKQNFEALRNAFTVDGQCLINGIDFDNEEYVTADTIVNFAEILFDLGFEVTFCPYSGATEWQGYMQTLWNKGYQVSWWNLQCYSGGSGNLSNLQPWIDALSAVVGSGKGASYLLPGLAVQGATDSNPQQCPTGNGGMCESFAGVSNLGLAGGFIWKYDSILSNTQPCSGSSNLPTASDYNNAIRNGLNNNCG